MVWQTLSENIYAKIDTRLRIYLPQGTNEVFTSPFVYFQFDAEENKIAIRIPETGEETTFPKPLSVKVGYGKYKGVRIYIPKKLVKILSLDRSQHGGKKYLTTYQKDENGRFSLIIINLNEPQS